MDVTESSRAPSLSLLAVPSLWIGALGYFVDIYDLVLFGAVRVPSLKAIGLDGDRLLSVGARLLNFQMGGLLVGGFIWGSLADKRGRKAVLYGSILLYSIATLLNAFASSVAAYALLRLLAGIGLAGELGAAVTLVSESLPTLFRGYAATIISLVGFCGALVATYLTTNLSWQIAYVSGGVLGFILLTMRIRMKESPIFLQNEARAETRGDFKLLLSSRSRIRRFAQLIGIGVPAWYVIGVLVYFAPELGRELHLRAPVTSAAGIFWCYLGGAAAGPVAGVLSQRLRSRRLAIAAFLALVIAGIVAYFAWLPGRGATEFYAICALLGISCGYWALFSVSAAEQFGTNLRATVAITVPNLVRASTIPMVWLFRSGSGALGLGGSACALGLTVIAIAFFCLYGLPETFDRELAYLEV